jgi:DNA-binding MarR family transcriptional regulator
LPATSRTRRPATDAKPERDDAVDSLERIIENWKTQRPDVDTSPMWLLARLARIEAMKRPYLGRVFTPHGLNSGLFDALAALRRTGPPYRSTPTALAKATMLTTGGITGRLDALESAGLIVREASRSDRRVTYARLTPNGVKVVDELLDELVEAEQRLIAGLSQTQIQRLTKDLRDFEESVRAVTGGHMEAAN